MAGHGAAEVGYPLPFDVSSTVLDISARSTSVSLLITWWDMGVFHQLIVSEQRTEREGTELKAWQGVASKMSQTNKKVLAN